MTDIIIPEQEVPAAPLTLFGTDDPNAIVERASKIATALSDVIKQRHLTKRISGRDHVLVEGWTLLGSMLGVFAEVEWTRPIEAGWEARAVAKTLNGAVVGAAEAMCSRSESTWKSRDDYAIRSMAQTRAVSKALRLPLGFIIEIAGYSATPAEEMADTHRRGEPTLREQIVEVLTERGLDLFALERFADEVGVPKGTHATDDQLRAILARIQQPAQDERQPTTGGVPPVNGATTPEPASQPVARAGEPEPEESASVGVDEPPAPAVSAEEIAERTGGVVVPPKPGTDEYKALTAIKKAESRAYWEKAA